MNDKEFSDPEEEVEVEPEDLEKPLDRKKIEILEKKKKDNE